jgi:hypothetical protein
MPINFKFKNNSGYIPVLVLILLVTVVTIGVLFTNYKSESPWPLQFRKGEEVKSSTPNLIKNNEFNEGTTNWIGYPETAVLLKHGKWPGGNSYLDVDVLKSAFFQIYQKNITLSPGTYNFEFKGKANRSIPFEAGIIKHTEPYTTLTSNSYTLTTSWQTFKTTFTIASSTPSSTLLNDRIQLKFQGVNVKSTDVINLDGFYLTKSGGGTTPPPPTQVCGNGIKEGTEQCDTGTNNGVCPKTCSTSCTTNTCTTPPPTQVCGNGIVEGTEQCDTGTNNGVCPKACSSTCTTNTCGGTKDTKIWTPGHLIRIPSLDSPASNISSLVNNPNYAGAKGARLMMSWGLIEPSKNNYNWAAVDSRLNALKPGQRAIIQFWERDYWNSCAGTNKIPAYMKPMSTSTNGGHCIVKYWEAAPRAEMIRVLNAIATKYDKDPRFMGVMLEETAFGEIPSMGQPQLDIAKLAGLKAIHSGVAGTYNKSHFIQAINWLNGGSGACGALEDLILHIKPLGHGLSNPDSVPWRALPWDCKSSYSYAGIPSGTSSVPAYHLYRKYSGQMPIIVGNDTSQLKNPLAANPYIFNGLPMNMTNLVDHLYKTAITGYTYTPTNPDLSVPSLGGNFLLWNGNWWSKDAGTTEALTSAYQKEVAKYINNPAKGTNTACPTNINCTGN